MPSHGLASAFTQLWVNVNGAPWNYPTWLELTKLPPGLFSDNDSKLPRGWNKQNVVDVLHFFDEYSKIDSETERLLFAQKVRGRIPPGQPLWRAFLQRGWTKEWKLHSVIVEGLRANNVHPLLLQLSDNTDKWPQADTYLPLALDSIGLSLFGPEAFEGQELLPMKVRNPLKMIVQHSWDNLRRQANLGRKKLEALEDAALSAAGDLNSGALTKAKITKTIRAISSWQAQAQLFANQETIEKIEGILSDIQALMEELGMPKTETSGKSRGLVKVRKDALSKLATEEEVHDLFDLYAKLIADASEDLEASEPPLSPASTLGISFAEKVDGADPGVEVEMRMSPAELANELGFTDTDRLPFLFNRYRHVKGFSAWKNSSLFSEDSRENPDIQPLRLHYHQLAGLHAIARKVFSKTVDADACTGVLLADEVGLGKTAVAISLICFLSHIAMLQSSDVDAQIIPVIKKRPYLSNSTVVPCLPHLILVPGTLLSQWEEEFQVWFQPKKIDILLYKGGKEARCFWREDGLFSRSKHIRSQIVIIASHSALQQDFQLCFNSKPPKARRGEAALPWRTPSRKPGQPAAMINETLFGQEYLSVTLDEGHIFRNVNAKHSAAHLIMKQAHVRLVLTATPLHTSTKDVAAMGRLIGIPHFLTERAHLEEKDDAAAQRKARKALLDEELDLADDSPETRALKTITISAALRMQEQFEGRVIRRTLDSKDWEGNSLLALPPFKQIYATVTLTDRELGIVENLAQQAKDSVSTANGVGRLMTKKFYLEYRMATGYAKDDPNEEIPKFSTMKEWESKKSTKMDVCAQICRHLLSRDDAPEVEFKDGAPVFPPNPMGPAGSGTQDNRILIYQEFPSLCDLLKQILKLYGISALSINGRMSFEARDNVVTKFHNAGAPRVLIFSSVGSAGLNLSIANTIIFMDQPWSAQDERQIRGRAHRQPQKKIVSIYHLLADGTSDLLMSGMARGKRDMLDAFLSREAGKEMLDLLQGRTIAAPDEETEAGEKKSENPECRRSKRQKKAPVHLDGGDANVAEEMAPIRLDELDKNISKETVPIHMDKSDGTSKKMAPILEGLDKSTPYVSTPICLDESDEKRDTIRMDKSEANPSKTKWDGSISTVGGGDPLMDPIFIFTDGVGDDRSMNCSSFRDGISIQSGISDFTEKSDVIGSSPPSPRPDVIEPSFSQPAPDANLGSESTLDTKVQRLRQTVTEQLQQEERLKRAQTKAIDPKPSTPDTVLGKRKAPVEEDGQLLSKGKVSLRSQASQSSSSKVPSFSTPHPKLDNIKEKILNKLTPVHRRATKIADEALEQPTVEKTIGKNPFIRKSNGKK